MEVSVCVLERERADLILFEKERLEREPEFVCGKLYKRAEL